MLDRCRHDAEIVAAEREDFRVARAVTRLDGPRRGRVRGHDLLLPADRPRADDAGAADRPPGDRRRGQPERGDHLVVYSSGEPRAARGAASQAASPAGSTGCAAARRTDETDGNLEFRPRSNEGFVEDLRTARGVVAGGGFSLLSEAVYLGKPMLAIPLRGQFEQLMNARYLEREGYGICADDGAPRRSAGSSTGSTGSSGASPATSRTATPSRCRRSRRSPPPQAGGRAARAATRSADGEEAGCETGSRRLARSGPPASRSTAANGRPRRSTERRSAAAAAGRKRIALTYDDGPNPEQTPRLMEILARYDAHATFFLIGKWAEREPGLLRELRGRRPRDRQPHVHAPDDAAAVRGRGSPTSSPRCRARGRGRRVRVLRGRRRDADAPALRAPPARDPASGARRGLRPGDLVDHLLRLAPDRDRAQDRAPRREGGRGRRDPDARRRPTRARRRPIATRSPRPRTTLRDAYRRGLRVRHASPSWWRRTPA